MQTNEELLRKEEEEISKTIALSLEEYNAKQIEEQKKVQQQSLLHSSSLGMDEDWDEMLQEAIRQSIVGTDGMEELNRGNGFTRNSSVDYNDSHFNIVKNHFINMSYYLCNTYEMTKDKNDVIDNKLFWNDIYKYYKGIFLIIKNYIMCLIKRAQAINEYITNFECSGSSSDSKRRRRRIRRKQCKTKNKRRGRRGHRRRNSSSSSSSSSSSVSSSSDDDSSDSDCDDSDTSKSSGLSIRSLDDVKLAYAPINYSTKQYCKWLRKGNRCSKLNDHVYLYYLLQNVQLYEDSINIHNLVFGVNNFKYANKTDIAKWFNHNLAFNEHENINFGLRQFLNGPCGLISSVQGYLIIILLFNHKYNFLWGSDYFNVLKTNPDFMNFTNDLMGTGENVDTSVNENEEDVNDGARGNREKHNKQGENDGNETGAHAKNITTTATDKTTINDEDGKPRGKKKKDADEGDSDKELLALVCDNIKDLKYYCLVESLAYILYQCTDKSRYVVAFVLPECYDFYCYIDKKRENDEYFRDLKKIAVYYKEFTNIKDVIIFYLEHFILFSCATGVISFLYSVILTRGVENIRNDMDDMNHPLIGIYGHCSQELVNLLLTGRACSNVFDNTNIINNDQNNEAHVSVCENGATPSKNEAEGEKEKERNIEEEKNNIIMESEKEEKITKDGENEKTENADEHKNGKEQQKDEEEKPDAMKIYDKEKGKDDGNEENINDKDKKNEKEGEKRNDESKDNIILKGISKRPLIGLLTDFEAFKYCEVGNFYKYPVYPIWVISSSSHYTVLFSLNIRNSKCTSEELIKKQMDTVWKKYDKDNNKYIAAQLIPDFLKDLKVAEEYKSMFDNYSNDLGVLLYAEFKQFYMDLKKKEINSLKRLDPPKDKYFYLYDAKELPENSIHYFHLKEVDYDVSHQNYLSFFNTRWPNNTVELLNCRKTKSK